MVIELLLEATATTTGMLARLPNSPILSPRMNPSTSTAIHAHGLSKDYGGGNGLFGLDLEIERGEVFGFLGPNGAGKSTTMRLLLDLISPSSGSAEVLGLDSHRQSLRSGVALTSFPGLLPLPEGHCGSGDARLPG